MAGVPPPYPFPLSVPCRCRCAPYPPPFSPTIPAFPVHFMHDCTDILPEYLEKWRTGTDLRRYLLRLSGKCDTESALLRTFWPLRLGNAGHSRYLPTGKGRSLSWIGDGDHGRAYRTITPQHCEETKVLLTMADIITPTSRGLPSHRRCIPGIRMDCRKLKKLTEKLHSMGRTKS